MNIIIPITCHTTYIYIRRVSTYTILDIDTAKSRLKVMHHALACWLNKNAFFFFQCQCGNHTDNSECPNVNSEINNIRNMNMNINIYIYVAYKTIDSFDPLLQAATSQAKLKNISARMLPGHFPHCDFLGPRNENPPSLLNRTTLGAACSPTRRRFISPPDHA